MVKKIVLAQLTRDNVQLPFVMSLSNIIRKFAPYRLQVVHYMVWVAVFKGLHLRGEWGGRNGDRMEGREIRGGERRKEKKKKGKKI